VKRGNPTTESYTYDAVGNRLSTLNSSPWTYDDRNELLSLPNTTLTYDPNGNMATRLDSSGSWSYVFDVEDRLIQVFKNSAEVSRFAYDPLGRRVEKVAGTVTRSYVYDRENILRETSSSGPVLTYLHGPGIDEPLASEDNGGVRTYLHPDGLGSIVKTTNASGAAGSTFKYNAFGVIETGTPSYAYTGREWDAEAGLYYYRARYYDPKNGRFLSEDPIGFAGGENFYVYVDNNPVLFTDPFGLTVLRPPPPQPDPFWNDFGSGAGSMWSNYQQMRNWNTRGADLYFHCMANCQAAQQGPGAGRHPTWSATSARYGASSRAIRGLTSTRTCRQTAAGATPAISRAKTCAVRTCHRGYLRDSLDEMELGCWSRGACRLRSVRLQRNVGRALRLAGSGEETRRHRAGLDSALCGAERFEHPRAARLGHE
jgi:RHS repeat-associated protein